MNLLSALLKVFSGGAGAAVGTLATFAGIAAALAPFALFLISDKSNDVFVTVTYREASFWGAMIAVNLFVAWLTRRRPSE